MTNLACNGLRCYLKRCSFKVTSIHFSCSSLVFDIHSINGNIIQGSHWKSPVFPKPCHKNTKEAGFHIPFCKAKFPKSALASLGGIHRKDVLVLFTQTAYKDSLLTGFHLQQSWECWGSFLPNGRPRLLQRVGGNWTSNLQPFHGRPFLTKKKWKHKFNQARCNL